MRAVGGQGVRLGTPVRRVLGALSQVVLLRDLRTEDARVGCHDHRLLLVVRRVLQPPPSGAHGAQSCAHDRRLGLQVVPALVHLMEPLGTLPLLLRQALHPQLHGSLLLHAAIQPHLRGLELGLGSCQPLGHGLVLRGEGRYVVGEAVGHLLLLRLLVLDRPLQLQLCDPSPAVPLHSRFPALCGRLLLLLQLLQPLAQPPLLIPLRFDRRLLPRQLLLQGLQLLLQGLVLLLLLLLLHLLLGLALAQPRHVVLNSHQPLPRLRDSGLVLLHLLLQLCELPLRELLVLATLRQLLPLLGQLALQLQQFCIRGLDLQLLLAPVLAQVVDQLLQHGLLLPVLRELLGLGIQLSLEALELVLQALLRQLALIHQLLALLQSPLQVRKAGVHRHPGVQQPFPLTLQPHDVLLQRHLALPQLLQLPSERDVL
mmetsp:Transcript_82019/g.144858  ORF Transcript_82019/g.144858 Transcript_82019/m.144858 type:complete len:427 (-) Transcript_82019:1145-2425(-)